MEERSNRSRSVVIVLTVVVLILLAVVLLVFFGRNSGQEPMVNTPKLKYAEGVTVVNDPNALQKAVDDMLEKAAEGSMVLEYENDAYSSDGSKFACYIANAAENNYDMYVDIYADSTLTNEIYLSGLVRPGSAFREIELENPLETGSHTVYAAFTQVEEDMETIHAQILVTMNFNVTG